MWRSGWGCSGEASHPLRVRLPWLAIASVRYDLCEVPRANLRYLTSDTTAMVAPRAARIPSGDFRC